MHVFMEIYSEFKCHYRQQWKELVTMGTAQEIKAKFKVWTSQL